VPDFDLENEVDEIEKGLEAVSKNMGNEMVTPQRYID